MSPGDLSVRLRRACELGDGVGLKLEAVRDGLPVFAADRTLTDPHDGVTRRKIGLSLCSGCSVGCSFCFTRKMSRFRPLSASEIVDQARLALDRRSRDGSVALKFALKQMGDPLVNPASTLEAVRRLLAWQRDASVTVSTSGARRNPWFLDSLSEMAESGADIRLQFSCHSTCDAERDALFPRLSLLRLSEIAGVTRSWPAGRVTLNFIVMRGFTYDAAALAELFRPQDVFIKVNWIDRNGFTDRHRLMTETEAGLARFEDDLSALGFMSARRLSAESYERPAGEST